MSTAAKDLRQLTTDAEQRLWRRLRNRQVCGAKFRRQHPLPPYVVDFVCLENKLIIEADGGQHLERQAQDEKRTAFLEALRRLNPAQGNPSFTTGQHYPAWLEKRHRMQGQDLNKVKAVTAWFALEQVDKDALASRLGKGVFQSDEITVSRSYGGTRYYDYEADEARAVTNLVNQAGLPKSSASVLENPVSFS